MSAVAVAPPAPLPVWPPKAKSVCAERDDGRVAHRHLEGGDGGEVGAVGGGQHRGLVGRAVVAADEVDGAADGRCRQIGAGLGELAGQLRPSRRPVGATARRRTWWASRRRRRTTSSRAAPRAVVDDVGQGAGGGDRAAPRVQPGRRPQRGARGGQATDDPQPAADRHEGLPRERCGQLPGLHAGLERGRSGGALGARPAVDPPPDATAVVVATGTSGCGVAARRDDHDAGRPGQPGRLRARRRGDGGSGSAAAAGSRAEWEPGLLTAPRTTVADRAAAPTRRRHGRKWTRTPQRPLCPARCRARREPTGTRLRDPNVIRRRPKEPARPAPPPAPATRRAGP